MIRTGYGDLGLRFTGTELVPNITVICTSFCNSNTGTEFVRTIGGICTGCGNCGSYITVTALVFINGVIRTGCGYRYWIRTHDWRDLYRLW